MMDARLFTGKFPFVGGLPVILIESDFRGYTVFSEAESFKISASTSAKDLENRHSSSFLIALHARSSVL